MRNVCSLLVELPPSLKKTLRIADFPATRAAYPEPPQRLRIADSPADPSRLPWTPATPPHCGLSSHPSRLPHNLRCNDALALPAGDPRPLVGVRGVGQILALVLLRTHCRAQVVGAHTACRRPRDVVLDRELLGSVDDVRDHGTRDEVAVLEGLRGAVGKLEAHEGARFEQGIGGGIDKRWDGLGVGDILRDVPGEDVAGPGAGRSKCGF